MCVFFFFPVGFASSINIEPENDALVQISDDVFSSTGPIFSGSKTP